MRIRQWSVATSAAFPALPLPSMVRVNIARRLLERAAVHKLKQKIRADFRAEAAPDDQPAPESVVSSPRSRANERSESRRADEVRSRYRDRRCSAEPAPPFPDNARASSRREMRRDFARRRDGNGASGDQSAKPFASSEKNRRTTVGRDRCRPAPEL